MTVLTKKSNSILMPTVKTKLNAAPQGSISGTSNVQRKGKTVSKSKVSNREHVVTTRDSNTNSTSELASMANQNSMVNLIEPVRSMASSK